MKFKPIKPTDKKFQSGIYNYCDRWCERCPNTEKCFLYAKEQQKNAEHIAKGEDINDWDVVMKDIEESFKETHKLLGMAMKKHGITQKDLEKIDPDEYEEPDFQSHPLIKLTTKYLKTAHAFLDEFWYEQQKMVGQFNIEVPMDDIKDAIETISWYHTMLPTKIWRLLYEIDTTGREKDEELKEMMKEDIPKFFALVDKCITKSKGAIESFSAERKLQPERIKEMLRLLEQVEQGVRELKVM